MGLYRDCSECGEECYDLGPESKITTCVSCFIKQNKPVIGSTAFKVFVVILSILVIGITMCSVFSPLYR